MGTGIHLPTPQGLIVVDDVESDNLVAELVVAPDQYAVIYEGAIGNDALGGGSSPDLELHNEAGVAFSANTDVGPPGELLKLPTPIAFPYGENVKLVSVFSVTPYTAGSMLLCYGLGGNVGSGSGIPTPRAFDNVANNGADREVVITPAAGEHVVLFGANSGDDTTGTTTSFQVLAGGVVYSSDSLAAPGSPDSLTSLDNLMAFPKGVAVTVRMTATTGGSLIVSAALVY